MSLGGEGEAEGGENVPQAAAHLLLYFSGGLHRNSIVVSCRDPGVLSCVLALQLIFNMRSFNMCSSCFL